MLTGVTKTVMVKVTVAVTEERRKKADVLVILKEELEKIKDEIKENMMSAAQAAGAGNVPGEVARMIKELTEPKMNWRELYVNRYKVQYVVTTFSVRHVKVGIQVQYSRYELSETIDFVLVLI